MYPNTFLGAASPSATLKPLQRGSASPQGGRNLESPAEACQAAFGFCERRECAADRQRRGQGEGAAAYRRTKKMPSAWLGFMLPRLRVSHRCSLRASQGPLKGVNRGTFTLYLRGAKLSRAETLANAPERGRSLWKRVLDGDIMARLQAP